MKLRKGEYISLSIISGMFLAAFVIMPSMPCQMVSHWGMDGKPNGYMPKQIVLLVLPCMSVVIFLAFALISRIDPKGRMAEFAPAFDTFTNISLGLFSYIYALMILTGAGYRIDMNVAMSPFFAVLFFAISALIGKAKPNYYIGIRTPWTLESAEVWDKTHEKAGDIFRWCGIAALAGIFLPKFMILFALIPAMAGTSYLLWYSFDIYKKLKKPGNGPDIYPKA